VVDDAVESGLFGSLALEVVLVVVASSSESSSQATSSSTSAAAPMYCQNWNPFGIVKTYL
jgi:hypothetical protein